jgi:16S rRNA C967 or C1407 C5-methylase (RsmB/RsmF family)
LQFRQAELPTPSVYPIPVPWLDDAFGFYALPGDFPLQRSKSFQSARVYGHDVSSGAAVAALLTDQHDAHTPTIETAGAHSKTHGGQPLQLRVLDLCCSPGLKLCAMSDFLNHQGTPTMVIGVDVSESRMAVCKKVVHKYQLMHEGITRSSTLATPSDDSRIRLYLADGTTFGMENRSLNLVFDSVAASEENVLGKRKRMNKSARARQRKRLDALISLEQPKHCDSLLSSSNTPIISLFDRVLVDAECTTDGSLRHIQKLLEKGQSKEPTQDDIPRLTEPEQLVEVVELQKRLIASGFRLLREGGCMVYSTCSLSEDQNEDVVRWLLSKYPTARIVPLKFVESLGRHGRIRQGNLAGTIRFLPQTTSCVANKLKPTSGDLFGGGFFLAKISKE